MQGDTPFLLSLLEQTAKQLESIVQEPDPDIRRKKFLSVVQPTFYMLGDYEPTLKRATDRIGRTFIEV